jgi:hypothetical protein
MLMHRAAIADHHEAQPDRDPDDESIVREGCIDWVVIHLGDGPHVIPIDDLRPHHETDCWCGAVQDDGVTIHKALDQREQFQAGALPQ